MGLEHILNARSVAVVGASKVPTKRGYQTIRTLLDERYEGAIYPVNPKEPSICIKLWYFWLYKCFRRIYFFYVRISVYGNIA